MSNMTSNFQLFSLIFLSQIAHASPYDDYFNQMLKQKRYDPAVAAEIKKNTDQKAAVEAANKMAQDGRRAQDLNNRRMEQTEERTSKSPLLNAANADAEETSPRGEESKIEKPLKNAQSWSSSKSSPGNARLNLKEEDLPQEVTFKEESPTPAPKKRK